MVRLGCGGTLAAACGRERELWRSRERGREGRDANDDVARTRAFTLESSPPFGGGREKHHEVCSLHLKSSSSKSGGSRSTAVLLLESDGYSLLFEIDYTLRAVFIKGCLEFHRAGPCRGRDFPTSCGPRAARGAARGGRGPTSRAAGASWRPGRAARGRGARGAPRRRPRARAAGRRAPPRARPRR